MKPLIDRALASLEKPIAMRIFFLVSFLESALIPVPIESLSIPLLTARKNPWPVAFWGTISSVLGGVAGYFIGFALFESLGKWIIETYGVTEQFEQLKMGESENVGKGSWVIFMGAVSPIPFKLVSIAAGLIGFSFSIFLLVATFGRALRYSLFALAFHWFGDELRVLVHARPRLMSAIIIGIMIAGFVLLFVAK